MSFLFFRYNSIIIIRNLEFFPVSVFYFYSTIYVCMKNFMYEFSGRININWDQVSKLIVVIIFFSLVWFVCVCVGVGGESAVCFCFCFMSPMHSLFFFIHFKLVHFYYSKKKEKDSWWIFSERRLPFLLSLSLFFCPSQFKMWF